jgi:hypothetical protein
LNPVILYDNRFEDGALSATDTAAGFDVNNIKDLRPHSFWKAASYGTKYITEAPLTKDTLAQEEMRISPADGYAGVYLPASLDLTPHLGDRIVCLDSVLKKHIGYIKSVGNKAVNMTAAGTGTTGIYAADNVNLDMVTNNITLVWRGSRPDWTPSGPHSVVLKWASSVGYALQLNGGSTGIFSVYINGTQYNATVANTLVNGTRHRIVAVITRESASTAGSVVFYVDGVQLGASVPIPAGVPATVSNAASLYVSGYTTYRNEGTNEEVYVYNRALTAAEVLALEGGTIDGADQYGNQATPIYTSDFSAGADSWAGSSGATLTGNTDGINGSDNWLKVERTGAAGRVDIQRTGCLTAGKTASVQLTIYNDPGSTIQYFNILFAGGVRYSTQVMYVPAGTEVTAVLDFPISSVYAGSTVMYIYPCTSTGIGLSSFPTGTIYYVKNIVTRQAGVTIALEESGIDEIASLNSATLINSPTLPYTTFSGASATAFHAESDGSGPHVAGTTDAIPFVAGRKYRVQFTLTLNSGTAPYYGCAVSLAGAVIGGASATNLAVEGLNTYEFTCTGSDTGVVEFWSDSAATDYDISDLSIAYIGWKDSSTNELDAACPASGCAFVQFNNIVSTPDGSTYNWESKETGYNHEDAGGYAYKISESDACDALFLFGHNLETAEASVSVESTDDEVNWTERLAVFQPADDRAIMKLLTSFRAASKRLKIDTASVAPYIAIAILGQRMEFPFPPDSPYDPYNIGIESESELSVQGNHLGDVIYYYPIAQRVVFSNPLRSFITDTYKHFWDTHGRLRKSFAWAWDLTAYPDVVYFMKLAKSARLSMPLSVGTYADSLVLDMEGVAEP